MCCWDQLKNTRIAQWSTEKRTAQMGDVENTQQGGIIKIFVCRRWGYIKQKHTMKVKPLGVFLSSQNCKPAMQARQFPCQ